MGAYPQIADWNADGKKDLLVGDSNGKITYFKNTGTNANPVLTKVGFVQAGGTDILVNSRSTPVVVDWNNDGKQDLVVGEHTSGAPSYGPGYVRLYLNIGTNAAPSFSSSYQKIKAGGVDIQYQATAPEVCDLDGDGKKDLIVGDASGYVYFYKNTGTDANPAFTSGEKLMAGSSYMKVTYYARPDAADWNGDGSFDLLLGDYTAYVNLFKNASAPVLSVTPTSLDFGDVQTNLPLDIRNTGGGNLIWNITESPSKDWLSVSPANGTNNQTVIVAVDRDKVPGTGDTGTLVVNSNGGGPINVAITVKKPIINPVLNVDPMNLDFGKTSTSLQLNIKNTGGGTLNWTITEQLNMADLRVDRAYLVQPDADNDATNDIEIASPTAGQQVRLICIVANNGAVDANNWKLQCLMDGAVIAEGTFSLAAGASTYIWRSSPWTATSGPHKLEWKADTDNIVPESDETNNSASYGFNVTGSGLADLVVERAYLVKPDADNDISNDIEVTNPAVGQQIRLICKVNNVGAADATNWKIQCYLDGTLIAEGTFSLQAGYTKWIWRSAAWTATAGSHTEEWRVDTDNVVPESDETNNSASYTFNVTSLTGSFLANDVECSGCDRSESATAIDYHLEMTPANNAHDIPQTLEIQNSLTDWLSFAPTSGSNDAGVTKAVTVAVDRSKLSTPLGTATLWVNSNGGNKSVSIKVEKDVATPVLFVDPTILDFAESLTSLILSIKNAGGGSLDWSVAENPPKAWLSFSPGNGSNGGGVTKTVTVTVDRSQLLTDSDTGILKVTSNGGTTDVTIKIKKSIPGGTPIIPVATSPQSPGAEFWVDINVGDNTNPVSDLFGVSFDVTFTNTDYIDVVTPHAANVIPGSFMGSDVVFFQVVDEPASKVSIGISRKAGHSGVNGHGTVAQIKIVSKSSTPNNTNVQFSIANVTANKSNGDAIALTPGSRIVTITSGSSVVPIAPVANSPQSAGAEFWVDIKLGDNANSVSDLFGVSFELNFTHPDYVDVVTPHAANVIPGPFMGSDVIFFQIVDENASKVSLGISRKSGQGGVNGQGVIAQIKMVTRSSLPNNIDVQFSIANVAANRSNGDGIPLTPGSTMVTITTGSGVAIGSNAKPMAYALHENFPNPFNLGTAIEFELPQPAEVRLIIFDLQGHEVRRLVNGTKPIGYHSIIWDSRDEAGLPVTSGVYFYRIEANAQDSGQQPFFDVKKMILLK